MKKNYLLGTIVCALFLFGCSSIYTVKNFSSKHELYQGFNEFAGNKKINVTFLNDSSITLENGAVIKNDTLFAIVYSYSKIYHTIPLKNIKNIDYTSVDNKSAILLLNDGKKLHAENIKITNDTMNYSITNKIKVEHNIAPLSKIKQASYKNVWLGVLPGFLIGTGLGFIVGATVYGLRNNGSMESQKGASGSIILLPISTIAGIIWGWISGYNYVYRFNP